MGMGTWLLLGVVLPVFLLDAWPGEAEVGTFDLALRLAVSPEDEALYFVVAEIIADTIKGANHILHDFPPMLNEDVVFE